MSFGLWLGDIIFLVNLSTWSCLHEHNITDKKSIYTKDTKMKKIGVLLLLSLSACQSWTTKSNLSAENREPASKKDESSYFKSVSDQERDEIIKRSHAFKNEDRQISNVRIQDLLAEKCGPDYKYTHNAETGEYSWPTVTCHYKPDSDLTGMSSKFKCDFPSDKGDTDTRKVKYSTSAVNPTSSEVLEVFLGSTLSKLMGFSAATYCPVQLVCKDCPGSDPWSRNRSSAAPEVGSTQKFNYALVEFKQKGFEVNSRPPNPKPQGLAWEELRKVSGSAQEQKEELIDREVWMMFIHFLRHYDADPHNQKVLCTKTKEKSDSSEASRKYSCEESYVLTSDFGLSYPRGYVFIWDEPVAEQKGDECIGTLKKGLIGGAPGTGIILGTSFSEEARQKFLKQIEQITDDQWKELYGIAQYGSLTHISIDNWVETTRRKIQKLKKLNCPAFDTGKSTLSHN